MNAEEYTRLVFSFLGGGLVAAILNWIRASRADSFQREIEFVNQQLSRIYGPLYFLTGQNAQIHSFKGTLSSAYSKAYSGKKWSDRPATQENLKKETHAVIDTGNQYAMLTVDNNQRMVQILEQNYAYIDDRDSAAFQDFVLHVVRNRIEYADGQWCLPLAVYDDVGDIFVYRKEFSDLVALRFREKTDRLKRLRSSWWNWRR